MLTCFLGIEDQAFGKERKSYVEHRLFELWWSNHQRERTKRATDASTARVYERGREDRHLETY